MTTDSVVAQLDIARTALAEAKTIQETKKILDIASAAEIYAKRQQLGEEAIRYATSIKVEALAQLGRMLRETPRNKGGHIETLKYASTPTKTEGVDEPTLSQLGLDYKTSKLAQDIAELPEEQLELVKTGVITLAKAQQKQRKEERQANIVTELPPVGLYRTIVIDPPWPVVKIERDVRPNQHDFGYPTMTLEEISNIILPFDKSGCHVYLWATQKYIPAAIELFEAWGVTYQCLLTWVKNVGFTPFSWMYSTEHILFGHIGSLPLLKLGVRLDFNAKVREHSRKPDEFYNIVRGVSPAPRLDYFSREQREGFDQYGNDTERF